MNNLRLSKLVKLMRRYVCASGSISFLLVALPVTVEAQFNYIITNGTVTITGWRGPAGPVAIPGAIESLPVTAIGEQAFLQCFTISSLAIPGTVTNIAEDAFEECVGMLAITVEDLNPAYSSLDGVLFNKDQTTLVTCPAGRAGAYTIPTSVTRIGQGSFYWCKRLTTVVISSGVTEIGGAAFAQCTRLTSLTLPDSVTTIGEQAFAYCTGLTSISIGHGLATVTAYAFEYCTSLTSLTLPDNIICIGPAAFFQCGALQTVIIPNSVTIIDEAAFGGCTSLTSLTIPDSVTIIGSGAFSPCWSLTNVAIGNGVTSIGSWAFAQSWSLMSVTIGRNLTNIEDYAFAACDPTSIYFQGNAPSLGGVNVFDGNNTIIYYLPGTVGWSATFGGRPTALWPPPSIQTSPQTQTAEVGSAVDFRVKASSVGDLALGYQWLFNSTTRLSCTNSVLQLDVQPSQAGAYMVVVTNAAGALTSPPALLSVIAPVGRRIVPGLTLMGQPGTSLNLDFATTVGPAANWTTFDHVPLTATSQWYFDLGLPSPPQGFYRAWQSTGGTPAVLDLHMVPALTLTGAIGSSQRVDYINQFGPTDAWVTLATVTLTNTTQLYFDTSAIGQPPRLWRIVPTP